MGHRGAAGVVAGAMVWAAAVGGDGGGGGGVMGVGGDGGGGGGVMGVGGDGRGRGIGAGAGHPDELPEVLPVDHAVRRVQRVGLFLGPGEGGTGPVVWGRRVVDGVWGRGGVDGVWGRGRGGVDGVWGGRGSRGSALAGQLRGHQDGLAHVGPLRAGVHRVQLLCVRLRVGTGRRPGVHGKGGDSGCRPLEEPPGGKSYAPAVTNRLDAPRIPLQSCDGLR